MRYFKIPLVQPAFSQASLYLYDGPALKASGDQKVRFSFLVTLLMKFLAIRAWHMEVLMGLSFSLSFLLFVLDMYLPFFYLILVNKTGVCRYCSKPFSFNSRHDHITVFTLPTSLSIYVSLDGGYTGHNTDQAISISFFLSFLIIMGRSRYIFHYFILFWWIIMEFVDNVTRNPFHVILNRINVYTFRLFLLSFCLLWYIISIMIIWWLLTVHISQAYIDLYFTHGKIKDAFIF